MFTNTPPRDRISFSDLTFPIFVAGPAHCGKSNFVTDALLDHTNVAVIGTADVNDQGFKRHLESIQKNRPACWEVIQEPLALANVLSELAPRFTTIVIDSLNQWLGNLVVESSKMHDPAQTLDFLRSEVNAFAKVVTKAQANSRLVLVSSEVGASPSPPRISERIFRQGLGQLNANLAQQSPTVIHMQYGIPLFLKR